LWLACLIHLEVAFLLFAPVVYFYIMSDWLPIYRYLATAIPVLLAFQFLEDEEVKYLSEICVSDCSFAGVRHSERRDQNVFRQPAHYTGALTTRVSTVPVARFLFDSDRTLV
jgi:hypothetical protein